MWIDLSAVWAESYRPARVATVVREFIVDTAADETGSQGPSDG